MRALLIPRLDGPSAAEFADVVEPAGAHPWAAGARVLVEVHAAGVSFPDLLQTRGRYQHGPPAPYVPGGEFAGVVLEAPAGGRLRPGDRVAGLSVFGALAERVLAIPRYTVRLPDTFSFEQGAAFFLNYATAWFALRRAAFRDGESVLVHGAAGGVGTATLDMLRGRAAPGVALVSSAAKAAVAAEAGADHVVVLHDGWSAAVRELTGGRGVDIVVDPVGGDRVVESLRSLEVGGRLLVVGFAAGTIPEVRLNRLLLRDLAVVGVALEPWVERHPEVADRLVDDLETAAAAGTVRPLVGQALGWEQARDALGILDRRGAVGKVVVTVA